ncbi:MAG: carboxypeptidase regulatory-like domain-containing protein, partial [Bacteroidia bacterium]|nr:carboxypeptidase regulatory-like domain-containing protein [Bacteroidia bacterium]
MLKKFYLSIIAVFALQLAVVAQSGGIKVVVTDGKTKEAVPFATVVVFSNGVQAGVGTTDFDGIVTIKPLNGGKYDVKVNFIGYAPKEKQGVLVGEGKTVELPMSISNDEGIQLDVVQVEAYVVPLVDPDTKSGNTITREQYQNMATKNINSVASTSAGVYQADEGANINVRGSRNNGTQMFIDGERVIGGSAIPQGAVDQVSVILGGLPASYGDATGGVISITTRGPQSKFFGNVEGISSQLTDAFGYNFLGFSVGGPILTKKDTTGGITVKKPILGFILSGQGTIEKDADPSAIGYYKVNADKLKELEDSPLRPSVTGNGVNRNAEFLTQDDLVHIKARQNITSRSLVGSGKLDFKPTNNLNITLSGMYDYNNNHGFINEYSLLNPVNNPQNITSTWRASARITQKFGNSSTTRAETSGSNVKNAFFVMQVGYTKYKAKTQDDTHKQNYFDYGYVGQFTQQKTPTYEFGTRTINDGSGNFVPMTGYFMTGFANTGLSFQRAEVNPLG